MTHATGMNRMAAALALLGVLGGGDALGAQAATGDRDFVAAASAAGMTEVQASTLARERAGSAALRQFAATMVTDHTRANRQLQAIAQKDGLVPASAPTAEQQSDLQNLQALHGAAFDQAYAAMMRKDHHAAVALFQREAEGGTQADLKAFASQTLPTLQHHLQMAEQLPAQGEGGSSRP